MLFPTASTAHLPEQSLWRRPIYIATKSQYQFDWQESDMMGVVYKHLELGMMEDAYKHMKNINTSSPQLMTGQAPLWS